MLGLGNVVRTNVSLTMMASLEGTLMGLKCCVSIQPGEANATSTGRATFHQRCMQGKSMVADRCVRP